MCSSRCRRVLPLVILRGSGETTAALAREAAEHGVRTLAHAEGGGVLYVGAAADPAMAERLVEASLDRLGVCNRLNLLLVDRAAAAALLPPLLAVLERLGIAVRGTERREPPRGAARLARPRVGERPRARRVRHRRTSSTSLDEAVALANDETSGLAATIVTEDEAAAAALPRRYRGTAAFWNAPTRFTDGFALTGAPETGINVDRVPGPRGPVTYRDLWLRQYRVVGDGTQRGEAGRSSSSSARASSSTRRGRLRRELLRARAAEIAELVEAGTPVCVVSSGAIALGLRRSG